MSIPRGKGPKNLLGFREGSRAAFVSEMIHSQSYTIEEIRLALSEHFQEQTANQTVRNILDHVLPKLQREGYVIETDRTFRVRDLVTAV